MNKWLDRLRSYQTDKSPQGGSPQSVVKTGNERPKLKNLDLEGEGIMTITSEEFKKRKLVIRIRSEVLSGEEFYLVSNEELRDRLKIQNLVCYLPDEILALREKSHEMIKKIHETKKIFPGSKVIE